MKPSLSIPSTSSLLASPLLSQGHLPPASSTPSRWPRHSPGHQLLRQVSDNQIPGFKSPDSYSISEERPDCYSVSEERPVLPSWSNESARGSRGGSSDGWSMHAFSGLMASSRRERWSFDSESFGFNREKLTRSSSRFSTSPSVDLQTCGVCSKLLTEKSSWSGQKIIANNELSVVAVLTCGHVYHAECLENMTPEINKYDPACPVCTFGEKQTLKLSEKALRAEMDLKARNKRSRNRIVDSDLDGDSFVLDRLKSGERHGKGPKMGLSSSMKSSLGKPFLRRHFSFGGSKGSKSLSESQSVRKKGFFWAKSSKEWANPKLPGGEHLHLFYMLLMSILLVGPVSFLLYADVVSPLELGILLENWNYQLQNLQAPDPHDMHMGMRTYTFLHQNVHTHTHKIL